MHPVGSDPKSLSGRVVEGLKRLIGASDPKPKSGKTKIAIPGDAPRRSITAIRQSLPQVLAMLRADGAGKVGLYGDQAFCAEFDAAAPGLRQVWISTDIADFAKGAVAGSARALQGVDAVVAGGADAGLKFRHALRSMHLIDDCVPVHWVADNFEFCAGTLALPSEADDCDALLFNHFAQFFHVRDPLQFRIEAAYEDQLVRRYKTLGPNQSLNINLNEMLPQRRGPATIKVHVSHPMLTKGRHYRLRLCADVFWRGSHTIVHGSHQFFKNPNRRQEFRLVDHVVRRGKAVMTVPNYDFEMGEIGSVDFGVGAERRTLERRRDRRVEEIVFERPPQPSNDRRYYSLGYHGFGTSFWYALEDNVDGPAGPHSSIAGNHLCRVGIENRNDMAMRPEEAAQVAAAEAAGFMIHPCTLPITRGKDDLVFGFNFDASNPPFEDYTIRFYDEAGLHLGIMDWRKDFSGPAFIDDIVAQWDDAARPRAVTALVTPNWRKINFAPNRFVTTADLVCRHVKTGDQDMTEFQSSWRNLGINIPLLPHWLHPSIGVVGRTNVIGRARTKGGHRTAVLLTNASGNLAYRGSAEIELAVRNLAGEALSYTFTMPAFGSRLVWLDDVMPDLVRHLGSAGVGPLIVSSLDADTCAQVLSVSPGGAVGLQHLWGY